MPKEQYYLFIVLHVATSLLLNEKFSNSSKDQNYSENLYKFFVQKCIHIYGPDFVSYNVHNLLIWQMILEILAH